MSQVSRTSGQCDDHGVVEDRHGELDGYTVNFVTFRQEIDHTPLLKGLPDDRCQCPHWGYVFKGRVTYRFGDREEVHEAGDAFYVEPGHRPVAEPGTEILQFSPTEQLQEVSEAIQRNMRELQAGEA
jgi:hypothetical protein